jgi:methionyl-tRNA formyltransferase
LDDVSDVVERDLASLGAKLLVDTVDELGAGRAIEVPQDEREASYAPRLTKEEGLVDFGQAAMAVHNRIRGLRPWPNAYSFLNGVRLVFHHARLLDQDVAIDSPPGTIVRADSSGILVAAGDRRAVTLLQVQPEGRRGMSAGAFVAGHGRLTGQRFG